MLKEMRLSVKISLGFFLMVLLVFAVLGVSYYSIEEIREQAVMAKVESLPIARKANAIKLNVLNVWQWLTDISATRGLDGLNDGLDEAKKSRQAFIENVSSLKAVFARANRMEEVREMEQLEVRFEKFYQAGTTLANAYIKGGPAEGNPHMTSFDEAAEALTEALEAFVKRYETGLNNSMEHILASVELLRLGEMGMALGFALAAALIFWGILRAINTSLTKPIKKIIEEMSSTSAQVDSSARQLSSSSQAVAAGASEQAASLQETTSTLEEIAGVTRQNADNSKQAELLAEDARNQADRGSKAMMEMVTAINEIKDSSDQMAKIIKSIDEIAFQTNLLALNAAVEAARAGDAGKGFAVVAEEVRNLAQRSADSARSTSELIEDSQNKSEAGVQAAGQVDSALRDLNTAIEQVGTLIREVAAASSEQAQGVEQVGVATAQMDQVVQSNAAGAQETASTSEELSSQIILFNGMTSSLGKIVGIYSNGDEPPAKQESSFLAENSAEPRHIASEFSDEAFALEPVAPNGEPLHA